MVDLGRTESVCKKSWQAEAVYFLPFGRVSGGSRHCMAITTIAVRRKADAEESQDTQEREGV